MRKKILCYAIISLLFCPFSYNLLTAVENTQDFSKMEEAENTVLLYLNALQYGDLNKLKQSISKEYYKKNKTLLDYNKKYPEFLVKYYQGAQMNIQSIDMKDGNIIVKVEVLFSNGTRGVGELHLMKEKDAAMSSNNGSDNIPYKIFEITDSVKFRPR
ncbi:hypothetical protein KA005_40805 [bacterium]|nr:hypothetical protein [bacterium]